MTDPAIAKLADMLTNEQREALLNRENRLLDEGHAFGLDRLGLVLWLVEMRVIGGRLQPSGGFWSLTPKGRAVLRELEVHR